MLTYNDIIVPATIKTGRIISAYANEIDWEKVEKYTHVMSSEMLSHSFPAIWGFPALIDEDHVGQEFLSRQPIEAHHIGQLAWIVTNGHHRSLAAINAGLPYIDVELEFSTITSEKDLAAFHLHHSEK